MRFLYSVYYELTFNPYMFRALRAHLQEALHKQQLVYCVRIMLVGCYQDWSGNKYQNMLPVGMMSSRF
jgi:hypothetical protein